MANTKKILLINSPFFHVPGKFQSHAVYTEPPLGLAYIASYIRKYYPGDANIRIIDGAVMELTKEEILDEIRKEKPDIVGATAVTLTSIFVKELFREVKKIFPECLTVAGGPHATALPFDLTPEADMIVIGEGEETMVDILRWMDGVLAKKDIKGIAYLEEGKQTINELRPYIEDMDSIPFPARDLLPMERYTHQYMHKSTTKGYSTILMTRGCPFSCRFCGVRKMWGSKARYRNVENILAELQEITSKYGISFIFFIDDTFTANRKRAEAICHGILKMGLNIKWACFSRIDAVEPEFLALLKKAGCVEIQVGVESGDQNILNEINKNINLDQVREAFAVIRSSGLQTKAFFMIGNPTETKATVKKTIDFAIELNPTYAFFSILIPFPGISIFDEFKEKGYIKTFDWSRYNWYGDPVFETESLSKKDIIALQREAELRFYLRPMKIGKYAMDAVISGQFKVLFRNLFAFLSIVARG